MHWKHHPYFLIELLVGLWIISMAAFPLLYTHRQLLQKEYESSYEILSQKLAYDAYVEIKEQLYTHHTPYKKSAITLPPIVEYPVKEPIERIGRLELIKHHLEKKIALYSFQLETSLPLLNKNLKKYTYRILVKGVTND